MTFADPFDLASHQEQLATDNAVALVRARAAPEKHPHFDGSTCVECGDDIPTERLALGKVRCVYCQNEKERKAK